MKLGTGACEHGRGGKERRKKRNVTKLAIFLRCFCIYSAKAIKADLTAGVMRYNPLISRMGKTGSPDCHTQHQK